MTYVFFRGNLMLSKLKGQFEVLSLHWGLILSFTSLSKYCAEYVFSNLTQRFLNVQLRDECWKAVEAANKDDFIEAMKNIMKVDADAFN